MPTSCCICRQGQVRAVNQDRAGCFSIDHWGLYLVADGMGGHYAGERASESILKACSDWWEVFLAIDQRPNFMQSVGQLRELLQKCHEEIAASTPPNQLCGTTVVLLWLSGGEYALFSIGDSRCYLVPPRRFGLLGNPRQITADDVSREPHTAGKLLRALGVGPACEFSMQSGWIQRGMTFALCSDGIYKACPEEELFQNLRKAAKGGSLKDTAERIADCVETNGAPDNYSLILVRI